MSDPDIHDKLDRISRAIGYLRSEVAAMALDLQRIEEIAREFRYEEPDFDDPRDDESPA